MTILILDDLYRYNSWANQRLLASCDGLSDAELDEPREMGFGTLRNTLFHMLVSEEIWLERWKSMPWRPFPFDAEGLPLAEIARRLAHVAADRQTFMDRERGDGWRRNCDYKDSKGQAHSKPLDGLMLHVANHAIHHRAQALNFLKGFGRTVPGGLDYLFFRFAKPSVSQEPATVESMRSFGLEVETGASPEVAWDAEVVANYFAYGDWANDRLLGLIDSLDDAALDRSWGMGLDTIRKTALHLADAERWWLKNWTVCPAQMERAPQSTSIADLRADWDRIITQRGRFLASLDEASAQRVVTALVGPMSVRIPMIESLLQLCGHGTHHRAQLINMLRRTNITAPGCDYSIWTGEKSPPACKIPATAGDRGAHPAANK
jgi:uncharacterized damage-inducible protein DinB